MHFGARCIWAKPPALMVEVGCFYTNNSIMRKYAFIGLVFLFALAYLPSGAFQPSSEPCSDIGNGCIKCEYWTRYQIDGSCVDTRYEVVWEK